MEYKVVNEEWDYDWRKKPLEECVIFESENLDSCIKYAKDNDMPESRVVKSNGRIAVNDWYGAYDNDVGWEYD